MPAIFQVTYLPCRVELRAATRRDEETREVREDGADRSIRGPTKPLSASGVQAQGKLFLHARVGLFCRKSQGDLLFLDVAARCALSVLPVSHFQTIEVDLKFVSMEEETLPNALSVQIDWPYLLSIGSAFFFVNITLLGD